MGYLVTADIKSKNIQYFDIEAFAPAVDGRVLTGVGGARRGRRPVRRRALQAAAPAQPRRRRQRRAARLAQLALVAHAHQRGRQLHAR